MEVEDQLIYLCSLIHVYILGLCQIASVYTVTGKNSLWWAIKLITNWEVCTLQVKTIFEESTSGEYKRN